MPVSTSAMKEKLYDIAIDKPLTSARRKALNQHIARNLHSDVPLRYEWDAGAVEILRITADPMIFEVKFHPQKVEIYASAPLWARLLLTAKKKELLKQEIQSILSGTGFVTGENDDSQRTRHPLNG
jgi:hypothetical protein